MNSCILLIICSFLLILHYIPLAAKSISRYEDNGCPNEGYIMKEDQKCYKLYIESSSRQDAAKLCENDNAYLPSIESDSQQQMIMKLLNGSKDNFWLGLRCLNETYCQWDDGNVLGEFKNFLDDKTNADVGGCYYIKSDIDSTKHGVWIPTCCENQLKKFVICQQLSNTDEISKCPNNYVRNAANNDCYKYEKNLLSFEEAEMSCKKEDSNLVSINSDDDNAYVLNLVEIASNVDSVWIGLTYNGDALEWIDGSNFENYNKFKENYPNKTEGNSIVMIAGREKESGLWINKDSTSKFPSICRLKSL